MAVAVGAGVLRRLELHPLRDELHSLGENAGADSKSALDNAGLASDVTREVEDGCDPK